MRDDATIKQHNFRARRRGRMAGQSLIVAVIVLFVLLFVGGIFVALVITNLRSAERAARTTTASGFAESGIRYMDEQLTNSPQGADWRPIPDNLPPPADPSLVDPDYFWLKPYNSATGEGGFTRINFGGPNPSATRLGGRALIRTTYRPTPPQANLPSGARVNENPASKYLKLEAVGRVGQIIADDPTTYGNTERAGLRRELVAYKAIGITDYVRFITNKDNKPGAAALGSPIRVEDRVSATAADPPQLRDIVSEYIGPIRVNGDLTFYGENRFTLLPQRNDAIEVVGKIGLNGVDPNRTTAPAANDPSRVFVFAPNLNPTLPNVFPSDSPNFNTLGGLVRDTPANENPGRAALPDATGNQNLRSVPRLAPPLMDAETGRGGLTRYRALTRFSPPMAPRFTRANPINPDRVINRNLAGAFGWGTGLYINNRNDVQQESESLFGAYSLRGDWLQPNTPGGRSSYWRGDFSYVPPAVTIELTPRYMIITQSPYDAQSGRPRPFFRDENGNNLGTTRIVRYTDSTLTPNQPTAALAPDVPKQEGYPAERRDNPLTQEDESLYYYGEHVVFAEGNVRIRGVLGGVDPETRAAFLRHLTVVSNGTIYVDGNLLRDNITPEMATSNQALGNIKGRSSIALLAKDYVAVNTTQFLSPGEGQWQAQGGNNQEFFLRLGGAADPAVQQQFSFRLTPGPVTIRDYSTTPPTIQQENAVPPYYQQTPPNGVPPLSIFFRHSGDFTTTEGTAGSAINLFINQDVDTGRPNVYGFPSPRDPGFPSPPNPNTFTLIVPSQSYVYDGYPLDFDFLFPANQAPYAPQSPIGLDNLLAINYDVSNPFAQAAYRITRVGIVPHDVRIEAVIYAQEGSFFIIPGPWFNPDVDDTYRNYLAIHPQTGDPRLHRAGENLSTLANIEVLPRYPFYREPMDIRITVYGTVAENLPAQIGDQGAWLEKWGWVPRYYGSTGLPRDPKIVGAPPQGDVVNTVHGPLGALGGSPKAGGGPNERLGNGIVYEFDDRAILPYRRNLDGTYALDANGQLIPIRQDAYGRALPIAPRLPVAPGLLFFGESNIQ